MSDVQNPRGQRPLDALLSCPADRGRASAIVAPEAAPLSYGELSAYVSAFGAQLRAVGLDRTDRVAIAVPNGPCAATTFLGVIAVSACAPLNPACTADEFRFYLTDLQPAAIVIDATLDGPVRDVARSLDVPVVELTSDGTHRAGTCRLDGKLASVADAGVLDAAKPNDLALLLHTSGTTSRPKLVPLTHANLALSAQNVARTLSLQPDDRCLNVMPLFHIHGLVASLLASLASEGSVVCAPGFQATQVLDWILDLEPTWYTAVPTIHRAMLAVVSRAEPAIPTFRFVRSSSSALPVQLHEELERTFNTLVIEAYGMTEAAHQMASNPRTSLRRAGSVGPAAGPDVAIFDAHGHPRPVDQIGEIVIRGPNVMSGYLEDDAANADAFIDGWFRTGDQGRLDRDGFLTITGRLKEIINRGGEKIAPAEVEDILGGHPDVAEVAVFAVPHPRLGEDVAAAVVLRPGSVASQSELRHFIAQRLAAFKLPRLLVFVDEIPKGATGKVQRVGMAERLGLDTSATTRLDREIVEPRDDTERQLTRMFADVLQLDSPVSATDDFLALGADSLHLAELLSQIETEFGRALAPRVFLHDVTPEHLPRLLREEVTDSGMIVPIQPDGSRPPLFCVMRASTLVTTRHFVDELEPDQPLLGILIPEMHGGPGEVGEIEEIAEQCRRAVAGVQPAGPYYLFGYSLGGLVVYEMARQYLDAGECVRLVVMADTPYPEVPSLRQQTARLFSSEGFPAIGRRLRELGPRLWSRRPFRKDARANRPVSDGQASATDATFDLYATLLRERRYASVARPSSAPIVLLRTREMMDVHCAGSPTLRWEPYVTDQWKIEEIPGSHDSMLGEPHVHTLAAKVSASLHDARSRH